MKVLDVASEGGYTAQLMALAVGPQGHVWAQNVAANKGFTSRLAVPVIACGGAWTTSHLREVVRSAGASAAAAGSMFVYQGPHRAVLINYPPYSEIQRLLGT